MPPLWNEDRRSGDHYGLIARRDRQSGVCLPQPYRVAQKGSSKHLETSGHSFGGIGLMGQEPGRRYPLVVGRPQEGAAKSAVHLVLG